MPKYSSKVLSIFSHKVIKIEKSLIINKLILPTKCQDIATQIFIIPNIKLDYAKKSRQIID